MSYFKKVGILFGFLGICCVNILSGCGEVVSVEETSAEEEGMKSIVGNNVVEMIYITPEEPGDEIEEMLELEEAMKEVKHGSAANLAGATVILTFLTDDGCTTWNGDEEIIDQTRRNLVNASDWIIEECMKYGASPSIICDWSQDETLLSKAEFTQTLVREDGSTYKNQKEWLEMHFPIEEIKQEYGVDNVIYLFMFNTPYENEVNPWAIEWSAEDRNIEYEIINAYVRYDNLDFEAAGFAHEILHMFGAPDMYYANEVINQSYVDYCTLTDSRDIMFRTNMGEVVEEEFSELDAYYVGLIERPSAVTDWNLALSEYEE